MTKPTELLVVTQGDRSGAARIREKFVPGRGAYTYSEAIETGKADDHWLVQFLARHAATVRQETIEECARTAEAMPCGGFNGVPAALSETIASAIRALSPSSPAVDVEARARELLAGEFERSGWPADAVAEVRDSGGRLIAPTLAPALRAIVKALQGGVRT